LIFHHTSEQKNDIAYIDNVITFSKFNYSIELQKENEKIIKGQKFLVDSLVMVLRDEQSEGKTNEALQRQFMSENNRLKEMGEYFSKDTGKKVWDRLNVYVKEYGEKNHYQIILGTQGSGNIMFAEKSLDITEPFLKYANSRYEGE
tara:strand:+ start:1191 stop:1628 length:438 start_codon:yes stop_codon:yes gene_type:complete